ncbi:uncharacterized protein LOC112461237 [Temnothorax curvispinosus]|uniref:Uncharacterized protein LOC112461237 n=1 Tax=Temnothorax curvispinosus TaxID=300111 RepID=A0A6J1QIH1_9HYME|nr:uncharacterized protein LOC112461237 [Temnothorax curvispinosus]
MNGWGTCQLQDTQADAREEDNGRSTSIEYSADDNPFCKGCVYVEKGYKENILDFKPISERICILRFKTRFFLQHIHNKLSRRNRGKDDQRKESLYQDLERAYDTIPFNDIKLVVGDFNAKIGWEPIYRDVVGRHSLHSESNDNGMRVVDFAISRGMVVMSTQFSRKDTQTDMDVPGWKDAYPNRSCPDREKRSVERHERQNIQRR